MLYYNTKNKIKRSDLEKIKQVLLNDGIIIFPTETVYGIAASALSKKAIDKLYEAKQRPREKAINIMIYQKEEIKKYAYIRNDIEKKIIDNFMPGEITIILDKKTNFGDGFTKSNTIGVRIPNSEIPLEILKEVKIPLVVSSANLSGKANNTSAKQIIKDFPNVDIIIDSGIIEKALPSTIVRVENDEIKVLRQGKITKKQIEEC